MVFLQLENENKLASQLKSDMQEAKSDAGFDSVLTDDNWSLAIESLYLHNAIETRLTQIAEVQVDST